MRLVVPCSVALILALFGPLAAQVDHEHHGERLGRVAFPTSCGPAAQAHVERGVALLHSFWYEPAGDAFRDAVAADSTSAVAAGSSPVPNDDAATDPKTRLLAYAQAMEDGERSEVGIARLA